MIVKLWLSITLFKVWDSDELVGESIGGRKNYSVHRQCVQIENGKLSAVDTFLKGERCEDGFGGSLKQGG